MQLGPILVSDQGNGGMQKKHVTKAIMEPHTEQDGRSVRDCPKTEVASARTKAAYLMLAVVGLVVGLVVRACIGG